MDGHFKTLLAAKCLDELDNAPHRGEGRHSAQAEADRGLVVFDVVVCMLVCPFVCAAAEMLGKVAVAATAEP
jgi:hypothetical protein